MNISHSRITGDNPHCSPLADLVKEVAQHYRSVEQILEAERSLVGQQMKQSYQEIRTLFERQYEEMGSLLDTFLNNYSHPAIEDRIMSCELDRAMTFMQMVETIMDDGVLWQELFECLDTLKVRSKEDLYFLSCGQFQSQEDPEYYNPANYFHYDISELFVEVVSEKIDSKMGLSPEEYKMTTHLDPRAFESGDQLRRCYYSLRQQMELDDFEVQFFIARFQEVQEKVVSLVPKEGQQQSIYREFEKADTTRSGKINYATFCSTLIKLKLPITQQDRNVVFRYAMFAETKSLHELINRTYFISYVPLLNCVFSRGETEVSLPSTDPGRQLQEYRCLVTHLKREKEDMNQALASKENRIQNLQSRLLQFQLQNSNKSNCLTQMVKNDRKAMKSKYQVEISRLRKVNDSQKQMIDSYRVELENIMSEIHTRAS